MTRIMIVDDDADIRETVRSILEDEGFEVCDAANGLEALELLRDGAAPAVILLDLGMPVMNGQEFRAAQRAEPDLAAIPIVVITAAGDSLDRARSLEPAVILSKPFRIETLMAALDTAMG